MMSGLTIGLGAPAFGVLATLALRSSVLLAFGWLSTVLLRRAAPPARQVLWASVIVGVLLLPLLTAVLPSWRVLPAMPWQGSPAAIQGVVPAAEPLPRDSSRAGPPVVAGRALGVALPTAALQDSPGDWRRLAVILWAAGSGVVAFIFGLGLRRLRVIRCSARRAGAKIRAESALLARELGVGRPVQVLSADTLATPATWGLLRPAIVLPAIAVRWSTERLRLVLAHEMAHVARGDFAWRLLSQLGCVVYWFNPLVWVAARRLRLEQELACDLAVVARGTRPSTYAHHLLSIARATGGRPLPLVALDMARRSQMEGRLMSILENRPTRSPRRALLLPALVVLVVLPVLASAGTRRASAPEAPEAPEAVGSAPSVVAPVVAPAVPATAAAPVLATLVEAVPLPAATPTPVLAASAPVPRLAPAPLAPPARIAEVEPALAPAAPEEPSARHEMEIDAESRRLEEEIARRADEIADLVGPVHEEIARAMEEQIQPIVERMELVQLEMEPVQLEMSRIGEEMSEVLESELETQVETEELQRKAETLALEAMKRARLSEALAGAEGAERERIEQALRETQESLVPLREEMEALRLEITERHRARADEIRARLEPYHAEMAALRERMLPEQERMEKLRAELEPIRQQLEASREERLAEVRERLETLRQELETLRREREARRAGEESQ